MYVTDSPSAPTSATKAFFRIVGPAVLVVAIGATALSAWWFSRNQSPNNSSPPDQTSIGTSADTKLSDPKLVLLEKARAAMSERRLLGPAGDNAIEFYLGVLAIDAQDVIARQAILELIPPVSAAVSSTIAAGDFGEARRQLDLLNRMGASELRLASVREELTQAENNAALASAQETTPAESTISAPIITSPAPAEPVVAVTQPEAPEVLTSAAPVTAKIEPVARPPAPATAPAAPPSPAPVAAPQTVVVASVREARQIVDARPAYPSVAMQRRVEGWVELELLIAANGDVGDVKVVASEPARIFDREAMRAAQRWRFEPRQENGIAVSTRVRKTVNFKLNAG